MCQCDRHLLPGSRTGVKKNSEVISFYEIKLSSTAILCERLFINVDANYTVDYYCYYYQTRNDYECREWQYWSQQQQQQNQLLERSGAVVRHPPTATSLVCIIAPLDALQFLPRCCVVQGKRGGGGGGGGQGGGGGCGGGMGEGNVMVQCIVLYRCIVLCSGICVMLQ